MTQATTEEKIDKLLIIVGGIKLDLAVHIKSDEATNEKLQKVYNAVFGKNGDPSQNERIRDNTGHIKRVEKKVDEAAADFKKAIWKVLGPTLLALGAGIVWLIALGAEVVDKVAP